MAPRKRDPQARIRALGLMAAIVVFGADQASKSYVLHVLDLGLNGPVRILPVLDLVLVWNHGVTFGMFSGDGVGAWLFAGIASLVVAGLLVWLWRSGRLSIAIAIGAIAGGAVGNVTDRLRYGAVVDFIHAHIGPYSWYVFNVGDAGIVCGVAWLIIDGLLRRDDTKDRKAA